MCFNQRQQWSSLIPLGGVGYMDQRCHCVLSKTKYSDRPFRSKSFLMVSFHLEFMFGLPLPLIIEPCFIWSTLLIEASIGCFVASHVQSIFLIKICLILIELSNLSFSLHYHRISIQTLSIECALVLSLIVSFVHILSFLHILK